MSCIVGWSFCVFGFCLVWNLLDSFVDLRSRITLEGTVVAENGNENENQNELGDKNLDASNTVKDPDDWKTGGEPMTGAQRSYLNTLASEAHETVEESLTKAEASKRIDQLQEKTGRGESSTRPPASR
jgi:hypothetical protein